MCIYACVFICVGVYVNGKRDQTPRLNYLIFFISRLVSVHYLCQGT